MVLCVSSVVMAASFTFDSEIDPRDFYSWTIVEKNQIGPGEGTAIIENPDPNAKIRKAMLYIDRGLLKRYSYAIDGKTYEYKWNSEMFNYDLVK